MRLEFDQILNIHKGKPCVVACHGPSLNTHKKQIENLQKNGKILRFSVNEWYSFFDQKPDYWVVSNGEFTIKNSIVENELWRSRKYPKDVFNKYKSEIKDEHLFRENDTFVYISTKKLYNYKSYYGDIHDCCVSKQSITL